MVTQKTIETIRNLAIIDESKVESKSEGLLASAKDQDFGAVFGRDASIRIIFKLLNHKKDNLNLEDDQKIRTTLEYLIHYQGKTVNLMREEEPGKIPHEIRFSNDYRTQKRLKKMMLSGWPVDKVNDHYSMCYYGSTDSTLLFTIALCKYLRTKNGLNDNKIFIKSLSQAINWIEEFGDQDNDLFIEFSAANRKALLNHGWKDSNNSIQTPNLQRPIEPIALVEIQGYQYWALNEASHFFLANNQKERAKSLSQRAAKLKTKFNQDFWMEDKNFFAYALDGKKQQIRDITSNVGHLLITGIIDNKKLPKVVVRLMKPDILTPFGIRTLSTTSKYYSEKPPNSYHNGTIWPHDNALIYLGLVQNGFLKEAEMVKKAVLEAEFILSKKYHLNNVELYSVTKSNQLKPYPLAQNPQGWVVEANKEVFT